MNKNVLIVDDDRTSSLMIKKCINDLKFNISTSLSTGDDALNNINQINPDLVFMDLGLKKMIDTINPSGYIKDRAALPIIFMAPDSDPETIETIKNGNSFGFLKKPINKKELKSTIEMALLWYKMDKRLKDNELKYSTILNSIGDAVVVANSKGDITYINPVAELTTGYRNSEVIGKKLIDIIKIENSAINSLRKNSYFRIDDDADHNYLISKEKKNIPVDFSISPLRDKKNCIIGMVMVIRDITERIKSENDLQMSFNQLRKAMGGVIQAMASTIETRDPYTAGHQRRVADLARQIAAEMGLSGDFIEGVRMAGIIHDLGKISTPAEILSKPGKLTDIEFNLIQIHPQKAFEILKSIDFPWPIADIVYQHHERINGSGYPDGLKGDEILLEARILAVADVVEAMASHRPYRPALGMELALKEISVNKGVLYDLEAANACIKLFREKEYRMSYLHH